MIEAFDNKTNKIGDDFKNNIDTNSKINVDAGIIPNWVGLKSSSPSKPIWIIHRD